MRKYFQIENIDLFLIYRMADTASSNSVHMEKGWGALRQHIIDNKIKAALWVTRLFTIIFTIGYIIQIFGYVILNFCYMN